MRVKTVPEVPTVEEKLKAFTKQNYIEAVKYLKDEGYALRGILLRRALTPKFQLGVPIKLKADWDPELEGKDMIIRLRKYES